MTTISNYTMPMPPSPRAMMDSRIDAAVEAGSLSEVDSAALETALDSIDSALASSASNNSTSKLDPSGMKERMDSLIADQVSAGTLTEDQAATLQSLLAQGGPGAPPSGEDESMSVDGMTAMNGKSGPGPMRGPPPPPPADASSTDSSDSSTASDTDASSATAQLDSLIAFLENLRTNLTQSLYGSAASSTDSSNSGLVVDSLA